MDAKTLLDKVVLSSLQIKREGNFDVDEAQRGDRLRQHGWYRGDELFPLVLIGIVDGSSALKAQRERVQLACP